jgi:predicted phosphodiesterase
MARILVLSDTHYPFSIKGYEEFAYSIYKKYKCDTILHCGDLVDFHAVDSHHEPEPDAKDANTELDEAIAKAKKLYKLFPKVKLVLGNHDLRVIRAAAKAKLTSRMVVPFRDLLQLPKGWEIADEFTIDGVKYMHEPFGSGAIAQRTTAEKEMQSIVHGHLHSFSGISYIANSNTLVWGMNVGCGIDRTAYSMRYGSRMKNKPTIGVGVVINGKPFYEIMDLGNKISRSR